MKQVKIKGLSQETKQAIYEYIKTLDLTKETKLPSEENMAQLLGVSRITVRSALNELASEGIIFRRQGKGTFANAEALRMKAQLNPVKQFKDIIKESGYEPSIEFLGYEIIKADDEVSENLNIKKNEDVVMIRKMFYADGNPCTYCVDYLPLKIIGNKKLCYLIKDHEDSNFEFLKEKFGIYVSWDKVEIKTVTNLSEPNISDVFECKDKLKSFLLLEGLNFDKEDNLIIYAKEYINTEFVRFNLIRQRII
ncbi:MAG: GntR family transcriptional regulator [Peptostreptococcaceae bacterium]